MEADCPSSHQLTGTDLQRKHVSLNLVRMSAPSLSHARHLSTLSSLTTRTTSWIVETRSPDWGALASDANPVTSEARAFQSDKAVAESASRRELTRTHTR